MNPVARRGTFAPVAGVALLRLPRSFPWGSRSLSVARGSATPPRENPCGSRRGAWHFPVPLRGIGLKCHAPAGRAVDWWMRQTTPSRNTPGPSNHLSYPPPGFVGQIIDHSLPFGKPCNHWAFRVLDT